MDNRATELTFGQQVDIALMRSDNSRRWLMKQLKEIDTDLTDTQLSNRCKGVVDFKETEIKAIKSIFKKHKIEL